MVSPAASQALTDEAQCLFLRLFLRKGPWFRLDNLSYSELTDIPAAAHQLCQAKFAAALYPFAADTATSAPGIGTTSAALDVQSGMLDPFTVNAASASEIGAIPAALRGQLKESHPVVSLAAEPQGCSLADAGRCSGQAVFEVAAALTVAELQELMAQLEVAPAGRHAGGISKGQMIQLLKGGLEKAASPEAEVRMPVGCSD